MKKARNAMLAAAALAAPFFSVMNAATTTNAAEENNRDKPVRWNHGNRGTPLWCRLSAGRRQAQRRKDARRRNHR